MKTSFSKKGFVLTLDITIAVFVFILLITAAHRHVANAEANRISNVQMVAAASDIVAMLDYGGALQTLDKKKIESAMNDLLPQNCMMLLKIVTDDGTVLYIGDSVPGEQFTASGKRFFTIKDKNTIKNYGYVSYWVWAR